MKLHLYFCSSYLAQKPRGKWCNALRCAALIAPYLFRQFAEVGRLSAMPRQGNQRGDLRPDSSDLPALYRRTLSGAV